MTEPTPADVAADDDLVEDLRARRDPQGRLPQMLAAWRDHAREAT